MKKDKCMGPIGNLGSKPIDAQAISARKWESSATDKRLDSMGHGGHKEGSRADKKADEASRAKVNRQAKKS